jgi:hypothetical protein
MAFKASNIVLSRAYDEIKREALKVKNEATSVGAAATAGDITASRILGLSGNLRSASLNMAERAVTPGLVNYAKTQEDDPAYDVGADYAAMMQGINAVVAWISTNLPTSGGYLQTDTLNVDGSITSRSFPSAQTAGLVTQLTALVALID